MAKKRPPLGTIHRLLVVLEDIEPPIWRRLEARSDSTLRDLHRLVQSAMGWSDDHLHAFEIDGKEYSEPRGGIAPPRAALSRPSRRDEKAYTLAQVAGERGATIDYLYDFGDSWLHSIIVEDVRPGDELVRYPRVIDGERACPPEDSGGVPGYERALVALGDPNDPEHAWFRESYAGFDPERVPQAIASSPPPPTALDEEGGELGDKIIRTLSDAGEILPRRVADRIVALGAAAVSPLLAAFAEQNDASPGAVSSRAAELLGRLQSPEAVGPMLEALKKSGAESAIAGDVIDALSAIGGAALEPALAAFADADLPIIEGLEQVVARLGVRDERIYARLIEALERDRRRGAALLAEYGDARAVPVLERVFDGADADRYELEVLADAIEELGGTLSVERENKIEAAEDPDRDDEDLDDEDLDDEDLEDEEPIEEEARDLGLQAVMAARAQQESEAEAAAKRLRERGRNDVCWCDSKAKYKKCHLRADELAARGDPGAALAR